MSGKDLKMIMHMLLTAGAIFCVVDQAHAQGQARVRSPKVDQTLVAEQSKETKGSIPAGECYNKMRCVTPAMRKEAAIRASERREEIRKANGVTR